MSLNNKFAHYPAPVFDILSIECWAKSPNIQYKQAAPYPNMLIVLETLFE